MKLNICLLAFCFAAPAWAAVDNTMPPGGVFGLKPGIYAQKGSSCAKASNTSVRIYDGKSLHAPSSNDCIARVVSIEGNRYTAVQSCLSRGKDAGIRSDEKYVVRTTDALNFSLRTNSGVLSYGYCPAYDLPAALQTFDPNK
ncbi:hypothetical protein OVA03_16630 [Asticcacaulis sp. SL142]|uniref:hypothetical protein n=1 Tax=Asticcacaulis sp. SL142 TaxID=2995155 RepID=UPI00226CCDF9|nr:hypothetical protein [Asticcacaulis sp. SL142]WAC48292.1 hypothetical protein OVA03_16630 [Asticcacaulis sp. SL142]